MPSKRATFNPVLTQYSSDYSTQEDYYIADKLFPAFPVGSQSAEYPVFSKENIVNVAKIKPRAPGTSYKRIGLQSGKDTYATEDYGLSMPIDDRDAKIYPNLLASQRAKTTKITRDLRVNKEIRARDLIKGSTLIPTTDAEVAWNDPDADIVQQVKNVNTAMFENCGRTANVITMTLEVWNFVSQHPRLVERIQHTNGGSITTEMIARLFEIDQLCVAKSNINESNEGQTESVNSIWGNDVIFGRVDANFDIDTPSLGRTFVWNANSPQNGEIQIKTHRDDDVESWIVTGMHDIQERVQTPACGYVLTNTLAE